MHNASQDRKYCFRAAGSRMPALAFAQSFWALTARDMSIEASLEHACEAGFRYLEVGLREERLEKTAALLKSFPLQLIAQGWVATSDEAEIFFDRASQFDAAAINLHLGHAYMTTEEACALIAEVEKRAAVWRIPMLVETHRGRLTQDLFRTAEVLREMPDIAITLDISHYIVAGETLGGSEKLFRKHLDLLLARTAMIHGRISNGQSIQVHSADSFAITSTIQSVWSRAMELWLRDAPSDAVLIFEPELGPPPYAYLDQQQMETFSRADETDVLVRLARQAWKTAHERSKSTA